ncbi:MAG: hypothetical protein U0Q16_02215 [Bryobacteraceae bacterium]
MTFDETHAYAPAARRFMSLGTLPAEVDNFERRDSSAAIPFFPLAILGALGRLAGSLEAAFIWADAVFPALAFALMYTVTDGIVERFEFRLALAWATLLIPFGPRNFLWLGYDALLAAPDFTRTPQPEVTFPLVLLAVVALARMFRASTDRCAILPGLLSALIVYAYYFYAVAWGMTVVMLLVLSALWGKWRVARRTTIVTGIMIVGAIPYMLHAARGRSQGGQSFLLARMGAHTHNPNVLWIVVCALGFLLMWRFGRRLLDGREHRARSLVLSLVLLAGVAGLNFHVVSGYDAQHSHFWNRLILPVGLLLVGAWGLGTLESVVRPAVWLPRVALAVMACMVLNAGVRQAYVGRHIAELQRASRPEIELLCWAREALPTGSVIGTVDPELILLIPAIAADFSYVPTGIRSLTPSDEIVDRYYEMASLLGMSEADVAAAAKRRAHVQPSQLLLVLSAGGPPDAFAQQYGPFHRSPGWSGRKLDFVVSDAGAALSPVLLERFPRAHVVHVNRRYSLVDVR